MRQPRNSCFSQNKSCAIRLCNNLAKIACYNSERFQSVVARRTARTRLPKFMAEFICRLGTPSGEIVTRVVEAAGRPTQACSWKARASRFLPSRRAKAGSRRCLPFVSAASKAGSKQAIFCFSISSFRPCCGRDSGPAVDRAAKDTFGLGKSACRSGRCRGEDQKRCSAFRGVRSTGIFPKIYTASILAGEKSGALDDVLLAFVDYLKRSVGVSRKLRGALAYPAFLAARGDDDGRVSDALHRAANVRPFQEPEREPGLPTVTVVVLWFSNGDLATISGGFCRCADDRISALFVWLRTASGKLMLHKFLLQIPIAGQLDHATWRPRSLSRSLSTLLSGGITVPDSWDIASQAINNLELRRRSQGCCR